MDHADLLLRTSISCHAQVSANGPYWLPTMKLRKVQAHLESRHATV